MRVVGAALVMLALATGPSHAQPAAAKTTVTCVVVDSATGAALPCRVYVQSAAGEWFFARSASPDGSAFEYRKQRSETSVEMHTTVSADAFLVDLPPGSYTIRIERGKEYFPAEEKIQVGDDPLEVKIPLVRWIDMAARGWYSGDTHVHRTLEELPNLLLAEDLNVGLPLSYWVTVSDTPPGSGDKNTDTGVQPAPISVDRTHLIWPVNTEYEIFKVGEKRHTLGAVFILGHTRPLKQGVPPVGPVAEDARRQGALLDLDKHSWPWSLMIVPVMKVDLFELANNHVWRTEFAFKTWTLDAAAEYMNLEKTDEGFTEWGWLDFGFQTYYALLNCGFRMRPTAGTASGVHPVPLGFGRVYVHLPDGFSYQKWMDGLAAGRSFVTTGPMLDVRVDDQPPGATIRCETGEKRTCKITGSAISPSPLKAIEVLVNGHRVHQLHAKNYPQAGGGYYSPIEATAVLDGSSWIAVRVFEDRPDGRIRFAHSSPVFVDVPGKPLRPRRVEVDYLIGRMKEEIGRNQDVLRDDGVNEYRQALRVFEDLAKEAR
jgi:hypothetical protein